MDQQQVSISQKIRQSVKITDLLSTKHNKRVDCPCCNRFKTASIINDEYIYCFSASCGFKADVIKLNSLLTFGDVDHIKESIKDLINRFNISCNIVVDKDKLDLYNTVKDIYIDDLKGPSLNYLLDRAITKDIINIIGVGYASGTSLRSQLSRTQLIKYGLLTSNNKEFFSNRIVFPLIDNRGYIASFIGRYIGELNDYIPRYKNLQTSINTLVLEQFLDIYNKNNLLCIAEGFVDTISLYQLGLQAVGILGVQGLLNYANKLKDFKHICFCFDSDKDDEGNYKSYKQLLHQIIDLILINPNCKYYIYLPKQYKDINDLLTNNCISKEEVINDKQPFINFLFNAYIEDYSKHINLIKLIEVTNDDICRQRMYDLVGKTTYQYVISILDYYKG